MLKAEKILKAAGLPFEIVPAPRRLSASCGVAIRFSPAVEGELKSAIQTAGFPEAEFHRITTSSK